jgi:3'-phosphoadenosine 5'-phosphosulfate sulfotransferase (PAPS reductase)/FAD synthetase
MEMLNEKVVEEIRKIGPKTVEYLYSAGKDSSLALLITRDAVKKLREELGFDVYMVYVLIPGNTHPLNAYAAALVMEWHRENYGFEPIYICREKILQEFAKRYGFPVGKNRWCFSEFKRKIFNDIDKKMNQPIVKIKGMSPSDSSARKYIVNSELELISPKGTVPHYSWTPLFSLDLSSKEKLNILRKHKEFEPIVFMYDRFGDSMNCMYCPYKSKENIEKLHRVEDMTVVKMFIDRFISSRSVRKSVSGITNMSLSDFGI